MSSGPTGCATGCPHRCSPLWVACSCVAGTAPSARSARCDKPARVTDPRAVLADYPIIDGHNDLPFLLRMLVGYDLSRLDVGVRQSRTQTDLVRMAEGGVGGQFWSVFVPAQWAGERAVTATFEQIDFVHRMVAAY